MKYFSIFFLSVILAGPALLAQTVDYWTPDYAPLDNRGKIKRLDDIEPRKIIDQIPTNITQSGSYYFTRNLVAASNVVNGIVIAADDVNLDLNGFVLTGTTNADFGITTLSSSNRNITVRNGVVRGWGQAGLRMLDGMNCRVSQITAIENGSGPAYAAISVGNDWDVDDCAASMNRNTGIALGLNSRARNCKVRNNMNTGLMGASCNRIENCLAVGNWQDGFSSGSMTLIIGCIANNNTNKGIFVGNYSIASGNIASENGGLGIDAGPGSRVERNISAQNRSGGITAGGWSRVTENQVSLNTGIGILGRTTCRVDGNHVFGHSVGISAASDAKGSFFVGNSAAGNTTNYLIAATDACFGQINDTSMMLPSQTNFSILNPWANFELPY